MGNQTKIQEYSTGQLVCTVPKSIAQAMRIKKGDSLEWSFLHGEVVVRKI